jgi:hypothetical protein
VTGFCAAPRHQDQDEPIPVRPHSALCLPCERGLASDLRRLPALHADLEDIPAARGGDGTGLPFSEPASDCRSQIRHHLTSWAAAVVDERRCDLPYSTGWESDDMVPVLAGWLHGQVGWCSFRYWAPDLAGEIRADAGRAWALVNPYITTRFPLPEADRACFDCDTGQLWVTIYVYSSDRRKSFIGCTECGARWEFGGAWLPFVRQVIRRRNLAAAG